jgi:UDP-glucuronate decarboxylase
MNKFIQKDSIEIINNLGDANLRFSGKTILLTGAAGFLGSQFVHFFTSLNDTGLLNHPCKIYCIDNFIRGVPEWLNYFESRTDVVLITNDIVKQKDFPISDFIIHAASIASPSFYRKHPLETMDANVIGFRNLLDFAVKNSCESFLFFSTSEIYGDPDKANIPTKESYRGSVSCIGPRACYDESKRFGETLSVTFAQQFNVPIKIVRPFNNYGPGLALDDKRVIPDFFNNIIHNRNIEILSDGKATRTFCYISDAITGYLKILLSEYNGEAFNIGSEYPEISMIDLANKMIEISGNKQLKIVFEQSNDLNYLVDNPNRRCPNIEKAKRLLNFIPEVTLEEGLKRTYSYYINNYER